MRPSKLRQASDLLALIILCFATAAIGSVAVARTVDNWYLTIHRPSWNPPNWLFAPVWTTLYLMMAISAWVVWRHRFAHPAKVWPALALFVIQLLLNTAWSWIFFAWKLPGPALVEIAILWLAIAATIALDWRISRVAALLLVPYLAWVTFASALNAAIWRLN
jgi:tryptophan-rich sensory protein